MSRCFSFIFVGGRPTGSPTLGTGLGLLDLGELLVLEGDLLLVVVKLLNSSRARSSASGSVRRPFFGPSLTSAGLAPKKAGVATGHLAAVER